VKIIAHVQITRVTSIYYSYFLHTIFLGKPMYKFLGEYCLNESKQQEYKVRHAFFLKQFLFQIKCCFFIYIFLMCYILC
jgi:hypothetical protein